MKTTSRVAGVLAASALLVLSATSARADIVYNDLDVTVDTAAEEMSLLYDSSLSLAGPSGVTSLAIQIEDGNKTGEGDHPGCNLQGAHYLELTAHVGAEAGQPADAGPLVDVALSNGGVLESCTDVVVATVTPLRPGGPVEITFTGAGKASQDPALRFSYEQATITVTVVESDLSGGGGATVCDADPAAPAWAAALLKGNNVKAKGTVLSNYIARVAQAMGNGATFADVSKNQHPDYENAVHAYMRTELELTALTKGPADVARPGWECVTTTG